MLAWLVACALLLHVGARSSGRYTFCDPETPVGCNSWENGNRLKCTEVPKLTMPWATAPVRSAIYELRSGKGSPGSDSTSYTPNTYFTLHLFTTQQHAQFRGLLLHAVNSAGDPITDIEFEFPVAHLWTPPDCPHTAMHNSAARKPYHVAIRVKITQSGLGALTFKALLKTGPANEGEFYYLKQDLVLSEAAPTERHWFVGDQGLESCSALCSRAGGTVDVSLTVSSVPEVQSEISPYLACDQTFSTCASSDPLFMDGFCFFPADTCEDWRLTSLTPVDEAATSNICGCAGSNLMEPVTVTPTARPSPAPTSGEKTAVSAASTPQVSVLSLLAGLALTLHGHGMMGALLLAVTPVAAHNWAWTPGRASREASTIGPCQGRKESDLHAQVGPGQSFTFKWAVGHNDFSYMVIVHGDHYHWLEHSNFTAMVDDYIEQADAASDASQGSLTQRLHGYRATSASYDYANDPNGLFSGGAISSSDSRYLDHERSPTDQLRAYHPDKIAGDRRVSYDSAKYPWIETAFRYEHLAHLPDDYSALRVSVPGRSGPGHYILHWRWSGYYDCVDIDYQSKSVTHTNGLVGAGVVFDRIDHCRFLEYPKVWTGCLPAPTARACVERMPMAFFENTRMGVQVQPARLPASVRAGFQDDVGIPWGHSYCANTPWTKLVPTTVTEKSLDWNTWLSSTVTTSSNTGCSGNPLWKQEVTLKVAVARCAGLRGTCVGISYPAASGNPTQGGTFLFEGCSATTTVSGMTAYRPKSTVILPAGLGSPITINFQKNEAGSGLLDAGFPYGNRGNGYSYGWNCAERIQPSWGECCESGGRTFLGTVVNEENGIGYMDRCLNMDQMKWEIALSNGAYKVETVHHGWSDEDFGGRECVVENVRLQDHDDWGTPSPANFARTVHIRDGRLTLAVKNEECAYINSIKITPYSGPYPPSWLPTTTDPWYQTQLNQRHPIGAVTVRIRDINDCSAWWLFQGNSCYDGRPQGEFDNLAYQGAVIGVSDSPCTASGCSGTTCGEITSVKGYRDYPEFSTQEFSVDCDGAAGTYVWMKLPGDNRILYIEEMKVNRAEPVGVTEDTMVCYGVEPRLTTATKPEYEISHDPEDPTFYSTCFIRQPNVTFLAPEAYTAPPSPPWHFNGEALDCKNYETSLAKHERSPLITHLWKMAPEEAAINCGLESAPADPPLPVVKVADARCLGDAYSCPSRTHWEVCADLVPPDFCQPCGLLPKQAHPLPTQSWCPADPNVVNEWVDYTCIKDLRVPIRSYWGVDRDWDRIPPATYEECAVMVAADPECGETFMFLDMVRAWGIERQCRCMKDTACCNNGACQMSKQPDDWRIYQINPLPADPTCENGVKSADGATCCQAGCGECSDEWSCQGRGLQCCTVPIVAKCSEVGAPCKIA